MLSTVIMGEYSRKVIKTIFLLNLIPAMVNSAEETTTSSWDLASSDMAERFFASSQIAATLISTDKNANDPSRVEWSATTPVPTACGASVFALSQVGDDGGSGLHYWRHFFSDAMDPSVPSVDHVVSMDIDNDDSNVVVHHDVNEDDINSTLAFRLFAFLPYGKGTLVSRIYALELPRDFEQDIIGEIPLLVHEMDYTQWGAGGEAGTGLKEDGLTPPLLQDYHGESPLAFSRGPSFGGESSGTVSAILNDSMMEFHLKDGTLQGNIGNAAAAFQYGLDPSVGDRDDSESLSGDAFDSTDGVDNGKALRHGLVRAQELSKEPYAIITPSSLSSASWADPSATIVVGATWIDSQMRAQYSSETRTLLSDLGYTPPNQPPMSTSVGNIDYTTNLCPTDSIRNIAQLSEGATILDVSSNYGATAEAVSSSYGAEKAIDGLGNTDWSSAGDGDDAFITIKLPFSSNLEYVEFHTRTMGASSQIFEYQVEVEHAGNTGGNPSGNTVIGSSCILPDAMEPFKCSLDHDMDDVSAKNVAVVTFRVVRSSGLNTGAMEIGVYGCSADEGPLLTPDESVGTCTTDDQCTAKVRSRIPSQSNYGVELCQCYAASSADPFDECEGEIESCTTAKCVNTCEGLEAHCLPLPDGSDETKVCTLQPIPESTASTVASSTTAPVDEGNASIAPKPSATDQITTPVSLAPLADESVGTCTTEKQCIAKVRSRIPSLSNYGVELCQCYAASSADPFDECEGETDATCATAKCVNTCEGLEAHCLPLPDGSDETKVCTLQPIPEFSPAPVVVEQNEPSLAPVDGNEMTSINIVADSEQIDSAGMVMAVSYSIMISLLVIAAFTS